MKIMNNNNNNKKKMSFTRDDNFILRDVIFKCAFAIYGDTC